jgi:integrase/recombinase XerD
MRKAEPPREASAPPTPTRSNPSHNVPARVPKRLVTLRALIELYGKTQVAGQAENTVKAKARDLRRFHTWFVHLTGRDDPAEWYPATTREFVKDLSRDRALAPATVHRIYSSVRHFARWAEKHFPFPHGLPTAGVKPPEEPEGEFKGLSRKDQVRLLHAAETLAKKPRHGTNSGVRDLAIVHALLASALRVSELVSLDIDQYDGRVLVDVLQKGNSRRARVPLNATARAALDTWTKARGDDAGPLFTTRSGARITREQIYQTLKVMERQANAQLPKEERFSVSPHVLRHTRLRRVAEEHGIQYARKLSGHKSDKYIWRYVQPSTDDFESAIDDLD